MIITKGLLYAARTYPNRIALIDKNNVNFTYKQFAARTAKLKNSLIRLGVKKGDRVACLMLNDFRYLELLYAITALGGIIVPLNTRLNVEELAFIINDSGSEVLFIHKEFLPILDDLKKKSKTLREFILVKNDDEVIPSEFTQLAHYEEVIEKENDHLFYDAEVSEGDVAALFYTGGTTGRPKGVMLTHKNLVANAFQGMVVYKWDKKDIYLHSAPMFHLADSGQSMSLTLAGAAHTFVRSFNPKEVLEVIQDIEVTACQLVPTMINMVLHSPDFEKYNLDSLRKIIYGASPIAVDLLEKGLNSLKNVEFIQGYGMTESSSLLTILPGEDHNLENKEKLTSCGQAVQNIELKIVDASGQEVPNGHVGEIVAKGPNIMKGYWNLPEETAKVLRNGWYYTGDLGYRDDENYYYIVDRAKDMIITGGENVYSIEVEQVLYEIPEILECAVIGIPDEKWGEAIKAVVVLKENEFITEDEIIFYVRQKLANYKVPKSVSFVDEIPKSGAGKILKRELRGCFTQQKSTR